MPLPGKKDTDKIGKQSLFCTLFLLFFCVGFVFSAWADSKTGADPNTPKKLYKQYVKTPSNQKEARRAILIKIQDIFPDSKEAVKSVKNLAGLAAVGGPWTDLPTKAAYIEDFLTKTAITGKNADSLQKTLLSMYCKAGRWDLASKITEQWLKAHAAKSSKRYGLLYKLGVYQANLGRIDASLLWFGKAKESASKGSSRLTKADSALKWVKNLKIDPVEQSALEEQSARAAKLFLELKPLKKGPERNALLHKLAAECPLSYHGRKAMLKLASLEESKGNLQKALEMHLEFLAKHPLAPEAKRLSRDLMKEYLALGMWARAAEVAAMRQPYDLPESQYNLRRSAWSVAQRWIDAGAWDRAAEWCRVALGLGGGLSPMPERLAAITQKAKGKRYLPAKEHIELIRALLDHCPSGEDTPAALMHLAGIQGNREDFQSWIWPDLRFKLLLLEETTSRFPGAKPALKAEKEIKGTYLELGAWDKAAQMEQQKFDQEYQGKKWIYAGAAFDLAVAWQRTGDLERARKVMDLLLAQKRLDWDERKKAELILQRLQRVAVPKPMSPQERKAMRDAAYQIYVDINSLQPSKLPDRSEERRKVMQPVLEKRKELADSLIRDATQTYHGNRAARARLANCLESHDRTLEPKCMALAMDYLKRYPHWPDSEDLWKWLVRRLEEAGARQELAGLHEMAARNYAHLWELDEQKQAMQAAQAWLDAKKPAKALDWFNQVVAMDQSGESRRAKEALKRIQQIKQEHPELQTEKALADKPLSLSEQKKLGRKLMKQAAKLPRDRLRDFKLIYTEIIERCPDTSWAQDAYWRLSNLYKFAYSSPKNREIVELLEQFLKRYPDSSGAPQVRRRLIVTYEDLGDYCKASNLSARALAGREYPANQLQAALKNYLRALKKCGRMEEVRAWNKLLESGVTAEQAIKKAMETGLLPK
ncbi:hypothetical protein X474_10885 [Dethiosulfatarculus sandiegensis]|uniref:Outer membrane lipoprotein BamD-like domain-containing protein n=1 Tax=Dethiosulfatarculus sandiegensis TaxID=1429043 RepID=A0A0D2JWW6_9BACT|nr:hypothetical protein X474_10885 [Dethiosulfatarculus sandiegensis]